MARKKKGDPAAAQMQHSERINTSIDAAENGFIVHVSGESGGKTPNYFSKRFIASTRPEALRIAGHHMSGPKGKGGKKKSKARLPKAAIG